MSFVFPQFASTTPKCRLFQKGGVSCDACNSAAVVICDSSRELYCAKHAPSTISSTATICNKKQKNAEHKKKVREYRERVHPASVKVATALRVELGLYGSVTSSPLCSSGVPMRVEGSVTLLLKAPRGNQTGGRGLLRMPELHSARLGPVLLSDGVSVWSLWLSNAMASLQWFNTQTMSESDAMGALIRESGTVYGQKFNYPGFKKTTTDLELRCLRIPPLLDASKNNDNNTVGYENMPVCIQELMLSGATLTPIEVPNHDVIIHIHIFIFFCVIVDSKYNNNSFCLCRRGRFFAGSTPTWRSPGWKTN